MDTENRVTRANHDDRWTGWRVWTIRVWYALLGLWTASMAHWAVRLGQAAPGEHFVTGAVTGWKLLAVGGVFVICWTGGRSVVAFHTLAIGWAAWLLSERLVTNPAPDDTPVLTAIVTVVLWLLPVVLLRPRRRQLLRPDLHVSAVLLPLALFAAVALSIYAVRQGDVSTHLTRGSNAAYDACGLGVVLAAQAVYAALRPAGTAWLTRSVGVAVAWIGLMAVIWPDDLTSPGRGWGTVMIGWAVLFTAVAEIEARRQPQRPGRQPTAAATEHRPTATGG
jgi:hypothetical protein